MLGLFGIEKENEQIQTIAGMIDTRFQKVGIYCLFPQLFVTLEAAPYGAAV